MKRFISVVLQTLLLLLAFAAGSIFWHPFGVQTSLTSASPGVRIFVWDGIFLMLLTFVLTLAVEAMRKRLPQAAPWSALALALATLLGLASKLGFITRDY